MKKRRSKKNPEIKKWYSDDELRLCVFGPEKEMLKNGLVLTIGDEKPGDGVVLVCLKDGDNRTAMVRQFEKMEEAKAWAERWCEQ